MRQAVCHLSVTRKVPAQIPYHYPWDLWRKVCKRNRIFSKHLVYHFQYHDARAPYAFTYLPPKLHNLAIEVVKQNTHTHMYDTVHWVLKCIQQIQTEICSYWNDYEYEPTKT